MTSLPSIKDSGVNDMYLGKDIERMYELGDLTKSHKKRYRELKLALLEEFGVCFWCGIKVSDYSPKDGERNPPDMATIDHTVSRYHREKHSTVLKVLSCEHCNTKRSSRENKKFGKAHKEKLKLQSLL